MIEVSDVDSTDVGVDYLIKSTNVSLTIFIGIKEKKPE